MCDHCNLIAIAIQCQTQLVFLSSSVYCFVLKFPLGSQNEPASLLAQRPRYQASEVFTREGLTKHSALEILMQNWFGRKQGGVQALGVLTK